MSALLSAVAILLTPSAIAAEPQTPPPRLIVFVSIDQMRAEYLERFRPVLEGGLLRLVERGAVFAETHHEHAETVTAPGHAALATGLFPSHSGIVGNDWFDRREKREVYCVEDRDAPVIPVGAWHPRPDFLGRSPRRLRGTALGDWMKQRSRKTKVFSIAGKDRSAVLMGGKSADASFWYDGESGQFVTSRYYLVDYPTWVHEFHRRRLADGYFGAKWEPLGVTEELLSSMEVVPAGAGAKDSGIPKVIGQRSLSEDRGFYHALFETPFLETYLLAFAQTLVREEKLGADDVTDLLALGFSSVDSVGHDYGPNGRETLDAIMRLDRELGRFFEFLDSTVGLSRVAVALSADHGVASLPEYGAARGLPGGRLTSKDHACFARALKAFEEEFGKENWFLAPLYFDYKMLSRRKVKREAAEAFLAKELSSCSAVAHVWTREEIEKGARSNSPLDPMLELYVHSFHPDRSPDVSLQLKEWMIDEDKGTTHGSAYPYDTHVPGILLWPGQPHRVIQERIATVDLSVTLAFLLGLEAPKAVDGVDRSALMQ